ncbi:MAG: GNAT family N-acetyltransferase [Candidatus Eisenbacteria bacterium]
MGDLATRWTAGQGVVVALDSLPLKTQALLLRHFVAGDAAEMLIQSNEDSARTWLSSQVYRDHAHALSALEFLISQYAVPGNPQQGPYVLAIEHRASAALVGHVGFSPLNGDVEVGFSIAHAYQGQGLASEAVVAASDWALRAFALERILGITAVANVASRRTLVRAGFVHLGDEPMRFQGTDEVVSHYALSGRRGDA